MSDNNNRAMEAMDPGHHVTDHNPKRIRRHPGGSCAGHHAGVICALPDDLLIAILLRVGDSRVAVSTTALSRRWRRLDPARWLPAFGFSVGDHLPPQYAAILHRYRDAQRDRDEEARRALARQVFACEDSAMEAYVRQLARFLGSPERYPATRSLRLEFYVTPPEKQHNGAVGRAMAACLASAMRWPQLERLAIYGFPRGVAAAAVSGAQQEISDPEFIEAPRLMTDSRLATLHVKNCLTKSGGGYGLLFPALSRLTVEITPGVKVVFPRSYFNDLLQSCRNLVFLRLVSCNFDVAVAALPFKLDLSPASKLGELVLWACNFEDVRLISAPSLERLVICKSDRLWLTVENAPRLATLVCWGTTPLIYGSGTARTLRFVELSSLNCSISSQIRDRMESFFQRIPKVEVLELCFRDAWVNGFWIEPTKLPYRFENLKKLLIHLPRMWPLRWIKKLLKNLLEAATCLEKLYIQFFAPSPGKSEEWTSTPSNDSADDLQHNCLSQIVMEGCTWTEVQIALIRPLLSSCGALKTVLLIPHHARQGGVACPLWLMKEKKAATVSQLRDGIQSNAEIIFG